METGDGVIGHGQDFGRPAKGKRHAEKIIGDAQVAELVLQHDGDIIGITRQQVSGDGYAGGAGQEGDIEMVLARQAFHRCGPQQPLLDHAAQRVLGQVGVIHLVDDQLIFGHKFKAFTSDIVQCAQT